MSQKSNVLKNWYIKIQLQRPPKAWKPAAAGGHWNPETSHYHASYCNIKNMHCESNSSEYLPYLRLRRSCPRWGSQSVSMVIIAQLSITSSNRRSRRCRPRTPHIWKSTVPSPRSRDFLIPLFFMLPSIMLWQSLKNKESIQYYIQHNLIPPPQSDHRVHGEPISYTSRHLQAEQLSLEVETQ